MNIEYVDLLPIIKHSTNSVDSGNSFSTSDTRGTWTVKNTIGKNLLYSHGFDKDLSTFLRTAIDVIPNSYIEIIFPNEYSIGKYSISLGKTNTTYGNMASWDIIARVDGVWVTVHKGTNTQSTSTKEYEFEPVIADSIRIKCTGKYGTGSWGFDDFYLYEAMPESINKTLILHNGEYKKYNNGWQTVSTSTPTVEQFISNGMDSLSPLLDRVNNISPLDSLTGDFETVTWTDEVDSTRALEMTVLQSPQLVYPKSDILLVGVETLDKITLTATGNAKVAISFDSGLTWKAYKNGTWETVTDAHSGMTTGEINALTGMQIMEARADSDFIRFSYYLGDENAEVDNIELKVSLQGTEKIASTSDYEVDYDAVNKTIIYKFKKSGTFSVNYVDTK